MVVWQGAQGRAHPDAVDARSPGSRPIDLTWIVAGWLAFFFVNNTLFSMLADPGRTFADDFFDDFGYYFFTTMAVLAVSPIVVFVSVQPAFLPLLLLPLYRRPQDRVHLPGEGAPGAARLAHRAAEPQDDPHRARRPGSMRRGAERSTSRFCLLDLDRFKEVNDTLGHQVGDRLLAVVAQRIQGALRPNDMVARLGGDEFAILLDPVRSADAAVEVAQRVRQALTRPFHVEGMLFELEASVGVAVFPEHGEDVDPIVRRADVAMYLAKEERTGVEVYVADRDRNSASRLRSARRAAQRPRERRAAGALPAQGLAELRRRRRRGGPRALAPPAARAGHARRVHPDGRALRTHGAADRARHRRSRWSRSPGGSWPDSRFRSPSTCRCATCTGATSSASWRAPSSGTTCRHRCSCSS